MRTRTDADNFLFHSVKPGRDGQCYFQNEKNRTEEAEQWLDRHFNGMLQEYGAAYYKDILHGEGHVRRENLIKVSPQHFGVP